MSYFKITSCYFDPTSSAQAKYGCSHETSHRHGLFQNLFDKVLIVDMLADSQQQVPGRAEVRHRHGDEQPDAVACRARGSKNR